MKRIDIVLDESGEKLQTELDDRLRNVKTDISTTVQNLSTDILNHLAWQVQGETGMFVERAVGQTRNFANTVRVYLKETPVEQRNRSALVQFLKAHASDTASAEESASAAGEMAGMAMNLRGLVAQFKLR
jgi:hypothetical protein